MRVNASVESLRPAAERRKALETYFRRLDLVYVAVTSLDVFSPLLTTRPREGVPLLSALILTTSIILVYVAVTSLVGHCNRHH